MRFDPEATLVTPVGEVKHDEKEKNDLTEKESVDEEDTDSQEIIVPELGPEALCPKVTAERLYSAFLAYLLQHARQSFKQMGGSPKIWKKLIPSAEFVMAIPDGWEDEQQAILRRAFVSAKILKKKGAPERLEFLREAEATVHAMLKPGEGHDWLKPGAILTVADLGGSTVDVCMYRCLEISPALKLEEVKPSDSVPAGGVYVDRAVEILVKAKLAGCRFDKAETVDRIVSLFEQQTKRGFSDAEDDHYIKFGCVFESDKTHDVSMGSLRLSGTEIEQSFFFCANEILAVILGQLSEGTDKSSHVVVTGGFGASPYLHNRLRSFLEQDGYKLVFGENDRTKPVAEGCALWRLNQSVANRALRASFGIRMTEGHEPENPTHQGRVIHKGLCGRDLLYGVWTPQLSKGKVLASASAPAIQGCSLQLKSLRQLGRVGTSVYVYTGDPATCPEFCYDTQHQLLPDFALRAEVVADLSAMRSELKPIKRGSPRDAATKADVKAGEAYWRVHFQVRLFVAETSLKAKITWKDKAGTHHEGPATVIPVETSSAMNGGAGRRLPATEVPEHA